MLTFEQLEEAEISDCFLDLITENKKECYFCGAPRLIYKNQKVNLEFFLYYGNEYTVIATKCRRCKIEKNTMFKLDDKDIFTIKVLHNL